MTDTTIGELETVPQNLFGISPIERARPYAESAEAQKTVLLFMGYERGVLLSRIAELNSRAEQILYIYLCRKSRAYLAIADRTINTSRQDDPYFYDWLDELATRGVAYASRRKHSMPGKPIYRWDEVQKVVDLCLSKGLPVEVAAKVASVGMRAVNMYLKYGIISLDEDAEGRDVVGALEPHRPPKPEETNDHNETQADILTEIANATSSRDASLLARDRVGSDYVRVSAINRGASVDIPGYVGYSAELQMVKHFTGEYTPFEVRVYFEEATPMQAVKFALGKWSEALSRIV